MKQTTSDAALLGLALDRSDGEPLHVQLTQGLRERILTGRITPGAKLPSSRQFATELGVSRVTIVTAIDQLVSEGYAEGRHGSGVYVSADLPEEVLQAAPVISEISLDDPLPPPAPMRPFQPAAPDLDLFPHADWAKLMERVWRAPERRLLANADPLGWGPLRVAIARHLNQWRGISCSPHQIIVTSGAAEAIDLLARAVLDNGDRVFMEEPGYRILRRSLILAGLSPVPVTIDQHGFDIEHAQTIAGDARAVVVTPSRQYPLGMTMPLARRLELIGWARQTGGLIIEDDYDSEYRYQGRPLPAMMSLEEGVGQVIYVGSFSKVMWPSLRIGFMVVPQNLVTQIADVLRASAPRASLVVQPVLARFMEDGSFATHIRKMRRIYARRQQALIDAVAQHLDGLLTVEPAPAGMHLIAELAPSLAARMDDAEASRRAAEVGVTAIPLSLFFDGPATLQGLVLGYAGFEEAAIDDAARKLRSVLDA
jgi:GntR family transcriptional regulator/MocR family aminotransferase